MRMPTSRYLGVSTTLLLLVLGGCSGDSPAGPSASIRLPALGTYDYHMEWRYWEDVEFCGSLDCWRDVTGTLTITYAAADSIAAVFGVEPYEPEADLGFWNVDAYVLYAQHEFLNTIAHRISVAPGGDGTNLRCTHKLTSMRLFTNKVVNEGSCTLTWQGN